MRACPSCGRESADDARFCAACGAALGVDTPAREERKVVSIVFVDLVGHTARSEAADPEDVRATLAPYHATARNELERYGGTVEKFIGDAVMAVFGAPVSHEDDAERAVRAALSVRDALVDDGLEVRLAVNTGEALVSLDARASEGEAMVAGDVVNTAARLQSAAPVNGILVGEATRRATERVIDYEESESVVAKGKREALDAWRAVGPRSRFGVDVAQPHDTGLVGRDVELRLLRDALDRVQRERTAQLVTLVGVPGIGKSRLVWELFRHVDTLHELIVWRQGRALAYGAGPFGAIAEAVRAHLGALESDEPAELEAKLAIALAEAVPEEQSRPWLADRIRPLVGIDAATAAGPDESFAAWRRLFEGIADRNPLVLVLEDVHWADEGTLDFVEHLVDWTTDLPLLVLCTARPELLERRVSWGGGRLNSLTVALAPLSDADIDLLLQGLLGQSTLGAEARARLLQQTGGNPLYAEEYARMLEAAVDAELPGSVQGIIAARLDLLDPPEKALLQAAAVLGKVFWRGGASALGAAADDELLQRLVRKEFIRRERTSTMADDAEFAFRHALVREVAYAQLPRAARAEQHRLAAEWITRSSSRPELAAHHYDAALDLSRSLGVNTTELAEPARRAFRAAGDRARALGALEDALDLYRRAVELWPDDPDRRALQLAMATIGADTLRVEARSWAESARDAMAQAGDLDGEARVETELARIAWFGRDGAGAAQHATRAIELAERSGSTVSLAYALSERARELMLLGNDDEGAALGDRALPLAEAANLDDVVVHLLATLGAAKGNLGVPGWQRLFDRAVLLGRAIPAPAPVFRALNNYGYLANRAGGPNAVQPHFDEMEEELRRYPIVSNLLWLHVIRAGDDHNRGNWDGALERIEAFFRIGGQSHYLDPVALSIRAMIAISRDDEEAGRADLEAMTAMLDSTDDAQQLGQLCCVAGRLFLELGDRARAEKIGRRLRRIDQEALVLCLTGDADVGWFCVDLDLPLPVDRRGLPSVWANVNQAVAAGELERAIALLDGLGARGLASYARLRRGMLEPGPWLDEAETFYSGVGATRMLRRIDELKLSRRSA